MSGIGGEWSPTKVIRAGHLGASATGTWSGSGQPQADQVWQVREIVTAPRAVG